MRINHICVMCTDLDRTVAFYRDVLGFTHVLGETNEPGGMFGPRELDDILGVTDARTRIATVASDAGTVLELQQASSPLTQSATSEQLGYGRSGITEIAFDVDDIHAFLERLKGMGVRTQTDYVWSPSPGFGSFLFYDPDGALLQVVGKIDA